MVHIHIRISQHVTVQTICKEATQHGKYDMHAKQIEYAFISVI